KFKAKDYPTVILPMVMIRRIECVLIKKREEIADEIKKQTPNIDDATQGESEIRRHIIESDLLDTIVMLPDQMFYNTGIYTYIWLLNNNKPAHKKNKVLIINAREQFEKEPKSFGNKRNRITDTHRKWIDNQFKDW